MIRGPMNRSGKLHALLSTARVANIPSVVSNVWLGVAIGIMTNIPGCYEFNNPPIPWPQALVTITAGICLYVAGNFLNDWMDREWDAGNRPERALPRNLFTPESYRNIALLLGVVGVALAALVNLLVGVIAVAITVCILIYTVWHKQARWSIVPMGLCRGFLPIMGALAMVANWNDPTGVVITILASMVGGGALFFYIVGLSESARRESMRSAARESDSSVSPLFVLTWLFALIAVPIFSWVSLVGQIPYIAWLTVCHTICRKPIPKYVSALLAGIPLVDWMILLPLALWGLSRNVPLFPMHPLALMSFALPPLAFITALLLQRLAPAT
jgi:4-hydroxybenzoate polyprenyltransferase